MAQLSAVEYIQKLYIGNQLTEELIKAALTMEKEQILEAYEQGAIDGRFEMFSDNTVHNAEAYYNKTFSE